MNEYTEYIDTPVEEPITFDYENIKTPSEPEIQTTQVSHSLDAETIANLLRARLRPIERTPLVIDKKIQLTTPIQDAIVASLDEYLALSQC